MPEIDVSVVIVNYNVKDFLFQCLRSVERAAKSLKTEIIVVDNHSSDGSVDYLEPLFPSMDFIRLEENLGFGRANNIGIEKARGRYVLILNPDTILEEKTLEVMVDYMDRNPGTGISGCKVLNPDGSFQSACRRGFPTPWASFCKLFGLQKIFPSSPLFARYNQTFRSIDETYYIDAVIGAFMFARRDALAATGGFDPEFFMYGEDLDLCYRVNKAGWKIAYVHETSIIHYKGESTKRSSINEVRHFYQAMRIFATKHYAHSFIFLLFLRLGIIMRSVFAYANKFKKQIAIILADTLAINAALLIGTRIRFGEFLGFPPYAYPIVFIVISLVLIGSMTGVGEYFESKPSIRRAFSGLMVSFFILSSLTYFFKQFAFSRGVLLMTIGFTIIAATLIRLAAMVYDKAKGKGKDRRIIVIGTNAQAENIIDKLQSLETANANLLGAISVNSHAPDTAAGLPVIGNIDYLSKIIVENNVQEAIITDASIAGNDIIRMISANPSVKFHLAQEYEEVVTARIVNEIAGFEPTIPKYNYTKFRYRVAKRVMDIIFSIFFLTIGSPFVFLLASSPAEFFKGLRKVLRGRYSFIGLYPVEPEKTAFGKPGLIGLAHASNPKRLSPGAINKLNNYYIQHYSISLDIDIFLKYMTRKTSGN